ncbi:hypothetical protein [Acidisoma sp. 7E03]
MKRGIPQVQHDDGVAPPFWRLASLRKSFRIPKIIHQNSLDAGLPPPK